MDDFDWIFLRNGGGISDSASDDDGSDTASDDGSDSGFTIVLGGRKGGACDRCSVSDDAQAQPPPPPPPEVAVHVPQPTPQGLTFRVVSYGEAFSASNLSSGSEDGGVGCEQPCVSLDDGAGTTASCTVTCNEKGCQSGAGDHGDTETSVEAPSAPSVVVATASTVDCSLPDSSESEATAVLHGEADEHSHSESELAGGMDRDNAESSGGEEAEEKEESSGGEEAEKEKEESSGGEEAEKEKEESSCGEEAENEEEEEEEEASCSEEDEDDTDSSCDEEDDTNSFNEEEEDDTESTSGEEDDVERTEVEDESEISDEEDDVESSGDESDNTESSGEEDSVHSDDKAGSYGDNEDESISNTADVPANFFDMFFPRDKARDGVANIDDHESSRIVDVEENSNEDIFAMLLPRPKVSDANTKALAFLKTAIVEGEGGGVTGCTTTSGVKSKRWAFIHDADPYEYEVHNNHNHNAKQQGSLTKQAAPVDPERWALEYVLQQVAEETFGGMKISEAQFVARAERGIDRALAMEEARKREAALRELDRALAREAAAAAEAWKSALQGCPTDDAERQATGVTPPAVAVAVAEPHVSPAHVQNRPGQRRVMEPAFIIGVYMFALLLRFFFSLGLYYCSKSSNN